MKRRDFVTSVLAAGVAVPVLGDSGAPSAKTSNNSGHNHGDRKDDSQNHQVSFGHWNPAVSDITGDIVPVDRMGADPNPRFQNGHFMIPSPIKVRVGDTVSFVISGFHNLLIYGPGTRPADISLANPLLAPGFPPIIDDAEERVYRGLDPRTIPAVQDRVEVVGFNHKGRFLVICGVVPHFVDATGFVMFGYVKVDD